MNEEEEFGIDWSERDGFQVRRMRIARLWGADSDKPLFKLGMSDQAGRLTRMAKLLADGASGAKIASLCRCSRNTVTRLRYALRVAEGLTFPAVIGGPRRLDLTGQRFGRITAVEPGPKRQRSDGVKTISTWRVVCDCGRSSVVATPSLRSGDTRSCGCYRIDTLRSRRRNARVSTQHRLAQRREAWRRRRSEDYARELEKERAYAARGRRVLATPYVRHCHALSAGAWPELVDLFRLIIKQRRELRHGY